MPASAKSCENTKAIHRAELADPAAPVRGIYGGGGYGGEQEEPQVHSGMDAYLASLADRAAPVLGGDDADAAQLSHLRALAEQAERRAERARLLARIEAANRAEANALQSLRAVTAPPVPAPSYTPYYAARTPVSIYQPGPAPVFSPAKLR